MKKYIIIATVIIVVVTVVAFSPTLQSGFTQWDDDIYVTGNLFIQSFSVRNLQKIFTNFTLGNYHPLTLLSYSLDYHLFKLDPRGYHTVNLILHTLNCILVFWLFYVLCGKIWLALIISLLFGVHPLRVETVAWVSDRKDLLYSFFFLSSLILYLYYRKKQHLRFYVISICLFVLSLLSKAMAVTLPVVLLLFDYLERRRFDGRLFKEKIPYFVIALAFGIIAIVARQSYQPVLQEYHFTFFGKIFVSIYRLVFYYLTRMIAPTRLAYLNPHMIQSFHPHPVLYFLPFIILTGIVLAIISSARYTRKIIFGSLFFFITIFPALTVIVLGYSADRFTYIPSVGISYIAAEGLLWLYGKRRKFHPTVRVTFITFVVAIIALLSFLTWQNCHIWKDALSLGTYFVRHYPNEPSAYLNRGVAFYAARKHTDAIGDFTQAIEIKPTYAKAYLDRGNVYSAQGNYDQAIIDFNHALEINPNFTEAYINRGLAFYTKKEFDSALNDFTQALRISPGFAYGYLNRANVYSVLGEYDEAINDLNQALRINPNYAEAYYKRLLIYVVRKEFSKAWDDAIIAQRLGIRFDRRFFEYLKRSAAMNP